MDFRKSKRAEMGIGTLIIFIALLLVAAVAAGVLIQTSGSLQEKALTTGDQARSQISTNVRVIEVSASDGSDGDIEDFRQIVKLSPGSDAVKITEVLFSFNTYDMTGNLKYRGVGSVCRHDPINGYYTLGAEYFYDPSEISDGAQVNFSDDLNDDLEIDYLQLDSAPGVNAVVAVYVSDGEGGHDVYNVTLSGNCSGAGYENATHFNSASFYADADNEYVDYISIDGACHDDAFLSNVTFVVYPKNPGTGYFTTVYLQRGPNPVDGNLQRGDVIQLCYEAPRPVGEDETIRLNFIPKIGTPTLTQFITPEVISTERVYLYP